MTTPLVHIISTFYSKNRLFSMPISHTVPPDFKISTFKCTSNDDCMNMDSYRSKPGSDPVYSCPVATCSGGACECGSDCRLDPYSGVCCQDLEVIGNDVFCVESKNTPLVIKDDNLTTDMILDSAGNPWDYISSPNNAFKRAGIKGKAAMLAHKQAHILSKVDKNVCNVPDQIIYTKDKKQYITVPGSTICTMYKKYQQ
jgi:hypothetical protein